MGQCLSCNCNGHASECDPVTGACLVNNRLLAFNASNIGVRLKLRARMDMPRIYCFRNEANQYNFKIRHCMSQSINWDTV